MPSNQQHLGSPSLSPPKVRLGGEGLRSSCCPLSGHARLTSGRKPAQTAKSVARKGITGNPCHLGGIVVNLKLRPFLRAVSTAENASKDSYYLSYSACCLTTCAEEYPSLPTTPPPVEQYSRSIAETNRLTICSILVYRTTAGVVIIS